MQTLGLSDSTPRSESRLKSLFWPSIQTAFDVDYLGAQGYWLCTVVAVLAFAFCIATGQPIIGVLSLLFYYLSGVGIREHSRYAAVMALVMSIADVLVSLSVFRILFAALLLSNLRATWIASNWKPESEEAVAPPRLAETWTDKFADILPSWLWPRIRILYYILSVCFVVLVWIGMGVTIYRGAHQSHNSGMPTPRSDRAPSHVGSDAYIAVRNQALQGSRTTFGLPASSDSTQPWGVVMDWGITNGTGTLLALSDGSASVYFSNGSGYLDSESQEAIRKAAKGTVDIAGEFRPQMKITTTHPLPQRGEVTFYLLTDSGVFTASAADEDLRKASHPLSQLRNAGIKVVTLLIQESKNRMPGR